MTNITVTSLFENLSAFLAELFRVEQSPLALDNTQSHYMWGNGIIPTNLESAQNSYPYIDNTPIQSKRKLLT